MGKPVIYCIVGPTASGKTKFSIELAKKIDAEIISADSMQIYKKLDIGSAKPTKEEQSKIKHHLIDFLDINETYSVAKYKDDCYKKIDEILKKNKNVIIAGGTGLYISSVVKDMQFIDENQEEEKKEYREYLYDLLEKTSKEYLHDMLKKVDIVSANEIHKNNIRRVIRALEIYKFSQKKRSDHLKKEKDRIEEKTNAKYIFKIFWLNYKRDILYERINRRVDLMLKEGLEEEAKMVYNLKLEKNATCMQAIGYKEFFNYFEQKESFEEVVEKLKKNTRNYAKRQETWFKKIEGIVKLDATENTDFLIKKIIGKE